MFNIKNIVPNSSVDPNDDISMDGVGNSERDKVLRNHKKSAKFFSLAETMKFMAAALLPIGLGTLIHEAKIIAGTGAMDLAAIGAAFATTPVVVMLGAAALLTAAAIGSAFIASTHHHRANFNSTEVNAQHTAKYIAKELKEQAACVSPENCPPSEQRNIEYKNNSRADGKQWTQIIQPKEHADNVSLARL